MSRIIFARTGRWVAAFACLAGLAAALLMQPASADESKASRIVAIGGSVTEIIYALGEEDRLVGRDSTSLYPEESLALPDVGYVRALSAEGVLSIEPDLIIAIEGAGPPEAVALLKDAGVDYFEVPDGNDAGAIVEKIRAVGKVLGSDDAAARLAERVRAEIAAVTAVAEKATPPRVLFILSAQGGRIMASGTDTQAAGIIAMAGGVTALPGMSGYRQVTDEAIIEAAPDVILMMQRQGDPEGAVAELLAHPAIAATPAGRDQRVIRMEGLYLLGFGPRTASAARELHEALYAAPSGTKR